MDIQCAHCGEPWNIDHLRHELPHEIGFTTRADDLTLPSAYLDGKPNPLMLERLTCYGWRFASGRMYTVLRCPCCPSNGPLPDARDRMGDRRLLADLLGDDEDELAAMLEELDLRSIPTTF